MIRLLIPAMPSAADLLPFLERIDANAMYTNRGPLVRELEQLAAERFAFAPCVAVANATLGLEASLKALNLRAGANVLVPAMTFRATGLAVFNAGLMPVLADINPDTWQLTPAIARECLQWGPIDAFLPVATFGAPLLDLVKWEELSAKTGRPVVIDAAGAFTVQRSSESPTVHTVYSLHATKHVGAGEGGIVASVNQRFIARVRELIAFGEGGTNAKLSEYHAAVALASLRPGFLLRKSISAESTHRHYMRALPWNCRVQWTPARSNHHMFNVQTPIGAGAVIEGLARSQIEARQWYRPFLDELRQFEPCPQPIGLDVTQTLRSRLVSLPFHGGLTHADIGTICNTLASIIGTVAIHT